MIINLIIVLGTLVVLFIQMPDPEDNWIGPPDSPPDHPIDRHV